ncbi:MAG: DinB family protein [Myxococcota bacterium]|nr:DinB family protein [Myxococcota bacterium]
MITPAYVQLMAAYGAWQNQNLFEAAETLSDAERRADRGAFFASIHGTFSHLLWGDQVWLSRLAGTPAPAAPDIPSSVEAYPEWTTLRAERAQTDEQALAWARRVTAAELEGDLSWFSGAIQAQVSRPRWTLVVQLFNHGTHHRGQAHALLTAAGVRPGDTDVQYLDSPHFRFG